MENLPESCDLVFYNNNSILSRIIKLCERSTGEPPTYASHVGGFISSFEILNIELSTSIDIVYNISQLKHVKIYRNHSLTKYDKMQIIHKILSYSHRKYGYLKILTHFLDWVSGRLLFRDVFLFRKLNNDDNYPICSWAWAFAFNTVNNYEFGNSPRYVNPDDMLDFVSSSDEWELIYDADVDR